MLIDYWLYTVVKVCNFLGVGVVVEEVSRIKRV
jgi:hypothetical protein